MLANGVRSSIVVGALIALACPAVGSPVNIDTFDIGSIRFGVFGATTDYRSEAVADATQTMQGSRDVSINTLAATGDGSADAMITGGKLALGTNTAVSPFTAKWTTSYGYGPQVDFVNDDGTPNTGILLEFLSAEYGYALNVRLSGPGNPAHRPWATLSVTRPGNPNPHTVFLPFAQFNADPGFTFTDVRIAGFTITGGEDGDYELDRISANVPEPTTLALTIAGAAFLLRRRRE